VVKRISCRVISSVAFSKPGFGAPYAKQPPDKQHEICDTVATVKPRTIINPVKNSDMPGISLLNLDFPTGQILDFYA
jgi:hypothetical protein